MSKKEFIFPRTAAQSRTPRDIELRKFFGMSFKGCPLSALPPQLSYRNINVIDHGDWWEGRPGYQRFAWYCDYPAGDVAARAQIEFQEKILSLFGNTVYHSAYDIPDHNVVYNLSATNPDNAKSKIIEWDEDAYLLSNAIFRIVFGGSYIYMYQINVAPPTVMPANAYPCASFYYRYMYSLARIEGSGNRNFLTDGASLVLETGTARDEEQTYWEVGPTLSISIEAPSDTGIMTCPLTAQEITHFRLFRTRQIADTDTAKGADPRFFIWDEDVPICKALKVTVSGTSLTLAVGTNALVRGDLGCEIYNAAGAHATIDSIAGDGMSCTIDSAAFSNGTAYLAIGEGRVMQVTCNGSSVLCAGANFDPSDEGRTLFLSDGTTRLLISYSTPTLMYSAENSSVTSIAGTISKLTDFAFRRTWSDTVPDEGYLDGTVTVPGLKGRAESQHEDYIPLFWYTALPSANVGSIANGVFLTGLEGETRIQYSGELGPKKYAMGQYHPLYQFEKLTKPLTEIITIDKSALIIMTTQTRYLSLAVSTNKGNTNVGELVNALYPSSEYGDVGVYSEARATIKQVASKQWIALTHEPAVRLLGEYGWDAFDLATIKKPPLNAVKDYLLRILYSEDINAWYSDAGGYKLSFSFRDEAATEIMCLRLALKISQGTGWSECSGTSWVVPKPWAGTLRLLINGAERMLIDNVGDDDNMWEEATFDRTAHEKPCYTDGAYGSTEGTEICWEKWEAEIDFEKNQAEHLFSNYQARPQRPENKGADGFDEYGYRDAQQIDFDIYLDDTLTRPYASVTNIPENGEVQFGGKHVKARRFLPVIKGAASEISFTKNAHSFLEILGQGLRSERTGSMNTDGALLASHRAFYVTRDRRLMFDRVNQTQASTTGVSAITGPDQRERSAFRLATSRASHSPAVTGAYTILVWCKNAANATFTGVTLTQYGTSGAWRLHYQQGTGLAANLIYHAGDFFDFLIASADITNAIEAYYNDVVYNYGRVFLPLF